MSQSSMPETEITSQYPETDATITVSLTHQPLSLTTAQKFVASPTSGANVFFTGTTRNTFNSKQVTKLVYSTYPALAIRTLISICKSVQAKHGVERIYVVHRLGEVKVGEDSIVIGVSAAHRGEAWRAGEDLLEEVKEKVEVWKREWFLDGTVTEGKDGGMGKEIEVGEWRANRDGPHREAS